MAAPGSERDLSAGATIRDYLSTTQSAIERHHGEQPGTHDDVFHGHNAKAALRGAEHTLSTAKCKARP